MNRLCFLLILWCWAHAAMAVAATTEFTLANGLKVLVREDHRANVVVVQVWYRVGASAEQDGQTGFVSGLRRHDHRLARAYWFTRAGQGDGQ